MPNSLRCSFATISCAASVWGKRLRKVSKALSLSSAHVASKPASTTNAIRLALISLPQITCEIPPKWPSTTLCSKAPKKLNPISWKPKPSVLMIAFSAVMIEADWRRSQNYWITIAWKIAFICIQLKISVYRRIIKDFQRKFIPRLNFCEIKGH